MKIISTFVLLNITNSTESRAATIFRCGFYLPIVEACEPLQHIAIAYPRACAVIATQSGEFGC